jgi:very-short-patch-repair endonuclease
MRYPSRPAAAVVAPASAPKWATALDPALAHLLATQHCVVTRHQLRLAGMSVSRVNNLLRTGRLHRLHCCVYWCGEGKPSHWSRAIAAALAATGRSGHMLARTDPGVRSHAPTIIRAAVSHRMAAVLHAYLPEDSHRDAPVDVTGGPVSRVRGVRVHRAPLGTGETVLLNGVPVTSPARTLLDLAGDATSSEMEQALAAGERATRNLRQDVVRLLDIHPRHRGSGELRRMLSTFAASRTAPLYLRSRAEEEALLLIRKIRVPMPLVNHRVGGYEVDFVWPRIRFVLEVDGLEFHGGAHAFHRDRERDRALVQAGYQVLRLTWRQLTEDAAGSAATLAAAIARLDERARTRPCTCSP